MSKPSISIVILTKNGGELFERSIETIFSQKIDFLFEVIVIDSGSTDRTLEHLKKYTISLFKIKPIEFCFGQTRDFGFSKAQGDYIVTMSQDVVPKDENWLSELVSPLINNQADVVQGKCAIPDNRPVFFWEKEGYFYFTSEGKEFCEEFGKVALSCTNFAIKRNVWERTKFGNIPMNEDKMLQKKLYLNGFKIIAHKHPTAYHGHEYSLKSLIKRVENEGMGWRIVGVKYTIIQMLKDLNLEMSVYRKLIRGIFKGEITALSEILFLFIRPIFLYKGNLLNKEFKA